MKLFLYATSLLLLTMFCTLYPLPAQAAEDDQVKGQWLKIPSFPADAVDMGFEQNDQGVTSYSRMTQDGMAVLVIERLKPLLKNDSPFTPEKARQFIAEVEEIPEKDISHDPSGDGLSEKYSYPVTAETYNTGANEDTRKNIDLYIFTDQWVFRVKFSFSIDFFEDFSAPDGGQLKKWIEGIEFVEYAAKG
jgi:hypothetical protein